MIHFPKTKTNKVLVRKIRSGQKQVSLSSFKEEKFEFQLLIPRRMGTNEVVLFYGTSKNELKWSGIEKGNDVYSITVSDLINDNEEHFVFSVSINTFEGVYYLNAPIKLLEEDTLFDTTKDKNQSHSFIFTFDKEKSFLPKGCIYHIFVDRFKRSTEKVREDSRFNPDWENGIPEFAENGEFLENNTHFGGGFEGIKESIPYLKNLNVDAIYLSPVNKSYSNHKYDTGSYFEIDENFGGEEKLIELCQECKTKNIKIIFDSVFNHTGDNSIYFNKFSNWDSIGAYNSTSSPYYNWYSFHPHPDSYDAWWGIKCLPSIKKGSKEFMDFVCLENGVIDYYYKLGANGLRLDVADELTLEFIKRIKDACERNEANSMVIGEVWDNATRKRAWDEDKFYFDKAKLDSVTNYPLMRGILDFIKNKNTDNLSKTIAEIYTDYPFNSSLRLFNIISTHDTFRAITYLASPIPSKKSERAGFEMNEECFEKGVQMMKCASFLQTFLPGIPCVYYGDEIGMQGFEDPFCRMPMQWQKMHTPLLLWYQKIMKIRKENRPLWKGGLKIKYCAKGCIIFDRTLENETVRIAVNCSDKDVSFDFCGYDLLNEKEVKKMNVSTMGCSILRL